MFTLPACILMSLLSPNAFRAQFATPPMHRDGVVVADHVSSPVHIAALCRDCVAAAQNISGGVQQAALCRDRVAVAADVCGKVRYGASCRDGVAVAKEAGGQVEDRPRACGGGGVRTDDESRAEQPVGVGLRSVADGEGATQQRAGASGLLPIPKIDAQVAFAVGANPNPALANNPLVTAPATRAPAILRGEFTMLSAIICCSNHDKNASIPLVAVPRYYATFPPWSGYQPGGGNGAVMVFPTWSVASDTSGAAQLAAPS